MSRLLSFPNPVNETSARLVAGSVAVIAIATIALQQGWLIAALAYGFLARALAGPTISPLGQLVTRVVTPRLHVAHRYAPGPAKRFAQAVGAVFTLTATLVYFIADAHAAAFALLGVLVVFATLVAAFGLCVGCRVFYLAMRLGIVPPSVCEDCARVLAGDSA
jgi:hypothetical protein